MAAGRDVQLQEARGLLAPHAPRAVAGDEGDADLESVVSPESEPAARRVRLVRDSRRPSLGLVASLTGVALLLACALLSAGAALRGGGSGGGAAAGAGRPARATPLAAGAQGGVVMAEEIAAASPQQIGDGTAATASLQQISDGTAAAASPQQFSGGTTASAAAASVAQAAPGQIAAAAAQQQLSGNGGTAAVQAQVSTSSDVVYQAAAATETYTTTATTTEKSSSTTTASTTTGSFTSSTATSTVTSTEPTGPKPLLFCWSHMQPDSDEEDLIRYQLKRRANIFACNAYAVISTDLITIGEVNDSKVVTWVNNAPKVTMGKYGVNGQKTDSFLNTQTFLLAWDTLMGSGVLWPFDFVVKVDPDAVFFPDRLRKHMEKHTGDSVYVPNCGKWGSGPKLYGSIEVFSVPAMKIYNKRVADCKQLPWKGWGEDYYMQHCMDMLGVQMAPDFDQVGDERCVAAPCSDWTKVAYHDFKKPDQWMKCFEEAIGR